MMLCGLDHIQLALPLEAEAEMRQFYCQTLGMAEQSKPAVLQGRGGFWALAGPFPVHFGIDPNFRPATKSHPCFVADDLDVLTEKLCEAGHRPAWDGSLPGTRRFFVSDPVGNRLEFMEPQS